MVFLKKVKFQQRFCKQIVSNLAGIFRKVDSLACIFLKRKVDSSAGILLSKIEKLTYSEGPSGSRIRVWWRGVVEPSPGLVVESSAGS